MYKTVPQREGTHLRTSAAPWASRTGVDGCDTALYPPRQRERMLFRLLGKTVWFAGKMAVKYVVVPIAITAATAIVLEKLAERMDGAAEGSSPAPAAARPARRARVNAEA